MKRKTEASPAELFRVEGIGAKGFGIIPRYAMCDPDLSWYGKVLYAYLCALAGSGNQTWPKKETVIGHLKIGNKTYHAAQKNLLDWGYITIQHTRQGNRQGVNIYTLVSSPPKLSRTAALPPGNEMSNRVISTGLKGSGYGMLPKLVMQDDRLCPKTKLVYAYLSSYAGAGCCAFPAVSVALEQLSLYKDAWRKGIRELTQCEYLQVVQRRVKGKFDVYDYYLLDKPQQPKRRRRKPKLPEVRKQDTGKAPGAGLDTPDHSGPEAGFDTPDHTKPEAGNDTAEALRPETGSDTPDGIHPEAGFDISEHTEPEAGFDTAGVMEPETGFDTAEEPAPETGFDTPETTAVQCLQKPQAGFDTAEPPPTSVFDTSETSPEAGLWQTGNDTAEASDTYYNYLSTDFSSNITPSIYQQSPDATPQSPESGDRWMDYEAVKLRLSEQLKLTSEEEANAVYGPQAQGAYELLNLLTDTLAGAGKTFLIGKQEKPKEVLWKLTPEHLRYVMDSVQSQQKRIFNLRAYLLTALYHATQTYAGYQSIQNVRMEKEAKRMQEIDNNQRQMRALIARLNGE